MRLLDLAEFDGGVWCLPDGLELIGETIDGPGVVVISSAATGLEVTGCAFTGPIDATWLTLPAASEGQLVVPRGALLLGADSTFRDCVFDGLTFAGLSDVIQQVLRSLMGEA